MQFVFCTELFIEKHLHFTTPADVTTLILFHFWYCSFYDKSTVVFMTKNKKEQKKQKKKTNKKNKTKKKKKQKKKKTKKKKNKENTVNVLKLWTHCFFVSTECLKMQFICCRSSSWASIYEPPHDKTNKMNGRPAKSQISLGIRY